MIIRALAALALLLPTLQRARAEVPPDGWLVFSSNRVGGRQEIYLARADGSQVTQLTTEGARLPVWSPDGAWIAYNVLADNSVRLMRWDRSEDRAVSVCGAGMPHIFWLPDGNELFCGSNDLFMVVDPFTGKIKFKQQRTDFPRLGWVFWPSGISRDRRWFMGSTDRVLQTYTYDNGSFYTELGAAVALDLTDYRKLYFIGPGCEPSTSPSGDLVIHVNGLVATRPDIYRLHLADLQTRSSYQPEVSNVDQQWGHEYMPRVSTDGKWLSYAASTGCQDFETCDYDIFVHRMGADLSTRVHVIENPATEQWPHLYVGQLWRPGQPPAITDSRVQPLEPAPPAPAPPTEAAGCSHAAAPARAPLVGSAAALACLLLGVAAALGRLRLRLRRR